MSILIELGAGSVFPINQTYLMVNELEQSCTNLDRPILDSIAYVILAPSYYQIKLGYIINFVLESVDEENEFLDDKWTYNVFLRS